ncbi:MAG: hypothetical protein ABIQ10_13295 [Gemmatimonadaceae bacterium]
MCEIERVNQALGRAEGDRATFEARVAVNETHADEIAEAKADQDLNGQEIFAPSKSQCDSAHASWPPLDAARDPYPIPAATTHR